VTPQCASRKRDALLSSDRLVCGLGLQEVLHGRLAVDHKAAIPWKEHDDIRAEYTLLVTVASLGDVVDVFANAGVFQRALLPTRR